MKKSIITIVLTIISLSMGVARAGQIALPIIKAKSYVVVGIAGFKTSRDNAEEIYSSTIGKGGEPSGVWTYLERFSHKRIFKKAYLTHFSNDSELNSLLRLFQNDDGTCKAEIGLILMVNSWGAKMSQTLARLYFEKCQTLPHLTIMIEGISKPTPFPYDKSILSFNCVNFYQLQSKLHGAPIANCQNILVQPASDRGQWFMNHIRVEWNASIEGRNIIARYLDNKIGAMFVKDEYGIDFDNELDLD